MNLGVLLHPLVLAVALIVLAVAVISKLSGAYIGAKLSGLSHWESFGVGAAMNARGIVEIVMASVGLRLGILNTAAYTIIILVAVVTSVMAAPMLRIAMRRIEPSHD